jgi:hypothetical protein
MMMMTSWQHYTCLSSLNEHNYYYMQMDAATVLHQQLLESAAAMLEQLQGLH